MYSYISMVHQKYLQSKVYYISMYRCKNCYVDGQRDEHMDRFFDCLNVRNTTEKKKKLKPFLEPYCDLNDSK